MRNAGYLMNINRTIGIGALSLLVIIGGLLIWFATKPKGIEADPFATSGSLSNAEVNYRTKMFDYAMDNVAANQKYTWTSPSARATIVVEDFYTSKSKADCRKYTEEYIVGKEQFTTIGTACRRSGDNGWCRIPPGGAETCALESPSSAEGTVMQKAGDAAESASDVLGKAKSVLR
jgi:hypothetical protein